MSEALKVAGEALDYIENLLVEMLEGDESIKVQLKITRNPKDFLGEC